MTTRRQRTDGANEARSTWVVRALVHVETEIETELDAELAHGLGSEAL